MKSLPTLLSRRMALAIAVAPLVSLAALAALPPYPVLQGPRINPGRNVTTILHVDDGNMLLAGQMFDSKAGTTWGWLAKTDGAGKLLWDKELGKKARNAYFMSAAAGGNGAILVGVANDSTGTSARPSGWIVAMTDEGRVVWDRALDFGQGTSARFIERTVDGTFLVAGKAGVSGVRGKTWVAHVDADGHVAPEYSLAVPDRFDLSAFTTTADGGFLVTGNYFIGPGKGSDGWIGRFDATGKPQWSRKLGIEELNAVVKEAADGSIVVAANAYRDEPVQLVRLSQAGEILQAPVKTGLCGLPTLWRTRNGQLRMAGLACPGKYGSASTVGLIADLAHLDRIKKIDAIPGGTVLLLAPLPERDAIVAQGLGPRQADQFNNVIATLPVP